MHFSEGLGVLHNNNVVQKLNGVFVNFFEDEEGIDTGLLLTLLLSSVWFSVRAAIPCAGVAGALALVLLGERETSIQAPKVLSRSLKTLLLFPAVLAVLLKDITSLINLVLFLCHTNGDCLWRVHLGQEPSTGS